MAGWNQRISVGAFHQAQVNRGKNWPFIYIEAADGRYQDPPDPGHPNNQWGWWPVTDGTDRSYDPANFVTTDINGSANDAFKIDDYVNAIALEIGFLPHVYARHLHHSSMVLS